MRDRRVTLSPAELAVRANRAAAHAESLPELARAHCVALYKDMRGEMPTGPLAQRLRARGVSVCYPRVPTRGKLLSFHLVHDERELTPAGGMKIHEPHHEAVEVALADIDVFIVPGLAFDLTGARIGWGAGYYDNTLAAAPRALRVGYAHELQLVNLAPQAEHDELVDLIVTEEKVYRPAPAVPSRRVL